MTDVVDVAAIEAGALVTFPVGRPFSRLCRFRKRFRKARHGHEFLTWIVPGATALRRVAKWIEDENDLAVRTERHRRAEAADREWDEARPR